MNDGRPRFKVVSVSGFSQQSPRPITSWYVLDRAVCHRIVATFVRGGTRRGVKHHPNPEAAARELAARLEHEHGS
jgi:hypothetical protein